jgi:hypothetical protein
MCYWKKGREYEEGNVSSYSKTLRKRAETLEIERGSILLHCLEVSFWKRRWNCRKMFYKMTTQSIIRLLRCYIILFSKNDTQRWNKYSYADIWNATQLHNDLTWWRPECGYSRVTKTVPRLITRQRPELLSLYHTFGTRTALSTLTALRNGMPFRPALGPTEPPSQHIPKAFSLGQSGQGVKMTTFLHPVTRLKISGAKPPL